MAAHSWQPPARAGEHFELAAITDDGTMLGEYARADEGGVSLTAIGPDGRASDLHRFASPSYGLWGIAVDAGWVCWAEGGTVGVAVPGWQLFAYNRHNRAVHRVASYAVGPDGVPLGNGPMPLFLTGDTLIWSSVTPEPPAGLHTATFALDLRGGPARVLADDAVASGAVGTRVFVTTYQLVGGARTPGTVASIDLVTGVKATFGASAGAIKAAAGAGGVIWVTGQPPGRAVVVAGPTGGHAKVVSRGGTPQFPVAAGRLLVWDGYDAGIYAYDPVASSVLHLTAKMVGAFGASGDRLFWSEVNVPTVHWFVAPAV